MALIDFCPHRGCSQEFAFLDAAVEKKDCEQVERNTLTTCESCQGKGSGFCR